METKPSPPFCDEEGVTYGDIHTVESNVNWTRHILTIDADGAGLFRVEVQTDAMSNLTRFFKAIDRDLAEGLDGAGVQIQMHDGMMQITCCVKRTGEWYPVFIVEDKVAESESKGQPQAATDDPDDCDDSSC